MRPRSATGPGVVPARGSRRHARRLPRSSGAAPEQVVWTSGATEANNLAIFGAARFHRAAGAHIVTSRTEHPSVLDPCRQLEREGFEVSYLRPGPDGIVEPPQIEAALRADTILVSLMHVNNETGVMQDVARAWAASAARAVCCCTSMRRRARASSARRHRATRSTCSPLTAHKLNGPKGVGALCVRREPRLGLVPLLFGGGQERGLRSGTLPTHQIAGMGAACRIAAAEMAGGGSARRRVCATGCGRRLRTLPGILLNGIRAQARRPASSTSRSQASKARACCSRCPISRCRPVRRARRCAASRRTCCGHLAAAISRRRVRCASVSAATRPRTKSTARRRASAPKSSGCGRSRRPTADAAGLMHADPRYGAEVVRRMRELPGAGDSTAPAGRLQRPRRAADDGAPRRCSRCASRDGSSSRRAFAPTAVRISSPRHRGSPSTWSAHAARASRTGTGARRRRRSRSRRRKFGRLITLQDAVRAAAAAWPERRRRRV